MTRSLGISYCILAITCIICLFTPPYDLLFLTTLVVVFVYAVLGACLVVMKETDLIPLAGDDRDWSTELENYHQQAAVMIPLFALPNLAASMWLNRTVLPSCLAFVHGFFSILTSAYTTYEHLNRDSVDVLVIFNSISLFIVSVFNLNVYAIYADAFYMFAHFWTFHLHRSEDGHVPVEDLYHYFLVAFMHYCTKALNVTLSTYVEPIAQESKTGMFELTASSPKNNIRGAAADINMNDLKENIVNGVKNITESICKLKEFMNYP